MDLCKRGHRNYSGYDENTTRSLFDNRCFKCGIDYNLTIDHHIPVIFILKKN